MYIVNARNHASEIKKRYFDMLNSSATEKESVPKMSVMRMLGLGFIVAIDDRKAGTVSRIKIASLAPIVAFGSTRLEISTGGSWTMSQRSSLMSEMMVLNSVCDV